MREAIHFESYGTMVVGMRFQATGEKTLRFHIVQAIDYPEIDHDSEGLEVATVNYFNLIGEDGEIAEEFEHANLLASGNFVLQYPEDKVNPFAYTIEFNSGVIFTGKEFGDFAHVIENIMPDKAFLFLNNQELNTLERVAVDFSKV